MTLQTCFFGFFQPNFRTASVNSFQPTAFHSYPICVHVLRFLVAIRLGCKKKPLPLEAGSAADSQLNAFFLSLVLALTKEKGHNLFFSKVFIDFTRRQLLRVFCETMSLAVT